MLRDSLGRPLAGDHFVHHGTDLETRWAGEVPHLTPNDRFFVRNHTGPADVDPSAWRLLVAGDGVVREATYSLPQLQSFSATTRELALECTGNGRRYFATQQGQARPGTQWGLGAIGVARWTGVPLATILRHAGVLDSAVQVMAVGLDEPYVHEGVNHGRVRRPLPIAKALDDVLIAWGMNGEPLPRDHGFPARLIVPGWVGIASIKWLGELRVTTTAEASPWNTKWYRMHGVGWSDTNSTLDRMPVMSCLDTVGDQEGATTVGRSTLLRGRAWAGEAAISRVEVSTDGGHRWSEATLVGANDPSCWVAWTLAWTPDRAGSHTVVVRATDSTGRRQPERAPDNDDGYMFSAAVRYPVEVACQAAG
ncbi:MAG TPA: sulfite oxidase [Nocardioides sp.]|nr:sulfite oxidase [Nocardioides sp.]